MFKSGTILIDDNSSDDAKSFLFQNPINIIEAIEPNEVKAAIQKLEKAQEDGNYLAGFFSYELGYCFEPKLAALLPTNRRVPLLWFGVFDAPTTISQIDLRLIFKAQTQGAGFRFSRPKYSFDEAQYTRKFEQIHSAICRGNIYQTNFTFNAEYNFCGSGIALYQQLREAQKTSFGGYINTGFCEILSLSPELFFTRSKDNIETRPMKGTSKRSADKITDNNLKNGLFADKKQRAENLMIVDLMRNDLSRIANAGSVKVPRLFTIEEYPTLFQMTSVVKAELKNGIKLGTILKAIFPSGSITGAPKIAAMSQIAELEDLARGVYCGAIGYINPNGDARFNVAIRTPVIFNEKTISLGIGSGIVYDSIAKEEYEECKLKARFIENLQPKVSLIETMLWQRQFGYARFEAHLARLNLSSQALEIEIDIATIRTQLMQYQECIKCDLARVRLLFGDHIQISHVQFAPDDKTLEFAISPNTMQSNNPWLYHKTTNRELYDDEWRFYSQNYGLDEIIYQNERDEITEGSRTNIFVDCGGKALLTPPIKCGLLGGILRQELLDAGKAREHLITIDTLKAAKNIYLGNSLRGLRKAFFKPI